MFWTIIIAILLLLAAAVFTFGSKDTLPRPVGIVPLVIAVIVLGFTTLTQVHAKELGVVTSFGKPTGELQAGFHVKAPWQKVTKINETIFTDTYADDHALPVRLGDGNTATVSATIRWHVDPAAAEYVYANYRSNDPAESLRDAVVDTQFKAAVNDVLSGFNPTAVINDVNVKDPVSAARSLNFSPDYDALSTQITDSMQGRVKDSDGTPLVVIDGITVAGVQYSQATEDRINTLVAQVAKTQQAVQTEATNTAAAKANEILEQSLKNDPYVLVSKCLDDLADGKFQAPAGFSCWPGGGSAVVVPGTTGQAAQ